MRKILSLFSLLIISVVLMAGPVNPQKARNVALNFMVQQSPSFTKSSACDLVYAKLGQQNSDTLFYVFNVGTGFVIVSADDAVIPILGYSLNGTFSMDEMPVNCQAWLQDYADAIQHVRTSSSRGTAQINQQWADLELDNAYTQPRTVTSVAPLLTTTWDQSPYYNNLCPGSGSNQTVTGCVATAMAQLINFWEYPAHGFGTHQYTDPTYGLQSADFANTTYQYSLMPNELTANSSAAQINAVATLMRHCGVAVNMEYDPDGSGAYDFAARSAFVNHFGYDAHLAQKTYQTTDWYGWSTTHEVYTDDEWIAMIKDELDAGRPLYYSGSGSGGHVFVCDGYDADDLLHINWGWGGWCDGYFAVGSLNPNSNYHYNEDNIVIFVTPGNAVADTLLLNMAGNSTQTVSGTVLIGSTRALNNYECACNYTNSCQETLVLSPATPGVQLLLEVVDRQNHTVEVYDGVGTSGTLLATINDNNIPPMMSSAGAITLVYSGSLYCSGLVLRVSEVTCLPVVMDLTCTGTNYTTADFEWSIFQSENFPNHNFNWQIEYGPQGFTPGTGTTVPVTASPASIGGLLAETWYDAYLHYTCTSGQTDIVGPVSFKTSSVMECFDEPIVNGNNTTDSPVAFGIGGYNAGNYHCSQEIYTASELSAMGLQAGDAIVSLAVQYKSGINTTLSRNIAIFMGHTNQTMFQGDGWNSNDWISWSSLSNVFTDKVVTISNVEPNQWEKFDFDTPFIWDGFSNVVIAFADSGNSYWESVNFASNTYVTDPYGLNTGAIYLYQWGTTPISYSEPLPTGITVAQRANMKLCLQTSCLKPTHLTYNTLNRHTVKLDWFPGYQETSWNVEYGPTGFTPGTGTTVTVNGNPTLTVSQLAAGAYDFYVQAVCGTYDLSKKAMITIPMGGFECAQIGEGTITNSIIPLGWYYGNNAKYTYTQQIYTADELTAQGIMGTINSLAIQYNGTNQTKNPVSIYLGNTTQANMEEGWVPVSQMELVYSGSVSLEHGWTTITFDNPFVWNGGSNLVVAFLNNSGTDNGTSEFYLHSTSDNMSAEMTRSYFIDINDIGNDVTSNNARPNIRFCGVSGVCTLQRDMEVSLFDGETYNFYGTPITAPGTYQHRWFLNEECDSLVVLHVSMVKIIFVTTTGAGAHDGSTWTNAMELQEAMDAAGTITDRVPYIYVKKGTYTGNQNSTNSFEIKPNVRAYGGFSGNEPANFDLANRTQANINQTVLFGSNTRRVLYQNTDFSDDQASVFDGFTIRGGTVNTAQEGGGAYIRKNCTLQNCVITANNAAISGSESNVTRKGVAVYNNGGSLINCEIYNNTINISGTGYGHRVYGVGVYNQKGVVKNCNIHDNLTVFDGNGDNWQVLGGGIYDYQSGSLIQDNYITHNSAERGGGLFLNGSSAVNRCVISNNTTFGNGGGVYASGNGCTLNHCLISNNAAGDKGGGVYDRASTFTSCNIVRNSAVNNGGGLYSINGSVLRNSIVWGNKVGATNNQLATNGNHHFIMESSAVEGGYSGAVMLEAENTGLGIGYPKFTNPTAEAGVDVNNAIGDWTFQNGSICINMGQNALAGGTTDLAGNPRIQQERVDIGAYESTFGMAYPLHPQAESNIIYVTTTGAGTQDGSSWANATSNLQYAMDVAMGCEPAAAVWVAHGTYHPNRALLMQPKVAVYGGFGGYEDYAYNLALRNFTTNATIIDGDSSHRVLEMSCPFAEEAVVEDTTEYYSEPVELLMPVSGTRDVTACSGTIYDNGGASGDYASYCNGTIILRSYNPSSIITLTGNYHSEDCCDKLRIYNGVGGDLIGTYAGNGNINVTSEPNGILVLTFTSDGSVCQNGFNLQFSCSDCVPVTPETPEEAPVSLFPIGVSRFDGFVFQNGYMDNSASGAYLLDNTEMANCDFRNNHSGLGVYSKNSTFNDCSFTNNDGIGLYGQTITANNCTASGNGGYGIHLVENSQIYGCTIENNNAGLKVVSSKATYCTIQNNGEANNNDNENYGVHSESSSQIVNSSIINNHLCGLFADGGLYVNVNIANNGSMKNDSWDWGKYVGGVRAQNNARFVNCNVVKNKVTLMNDADDYNTYGGIYNNSNNNEYTNCIIWENYKGDSLDNIQGNATFSYCAVEGGQSGIANINLSSYNEGNNPSLSYVHFITPATNAGATTQTNVDYSLATGSACINAGNPNTTSLNLPLYDLARSLRIKQNHIDIGPYEFGGVTYLTINDTICLGENFFYNDYFVYPEQPGLFRDTVIYNQAGMDYIAYINLMVNSVYNISIDASICEGTYYPFNGQQLSTTGTYPAYLLTTAGCDSTVVLNLTVNPTVYNDISRTACESFTWNGQTYTTSGNYVQTLTSATGCDSVVTLHLTINHASSYEYYQTACISYTWNNVTYSESGVYQQTLTNAQGCDSVVTLYLTIVDVITNEFSATACDSYTWNGTTYTLSGDKVQTFTAASGCDSVVTLHLTINQSNTGVETVNACDSYTWINGVTYTQTPMVAPTYTLTNTSGCDSVVTLHLTINHSNTTNLSVTACDSYTWNDTTYTTSGVYSKTFTNAVGCDSLVIMNLSVYSSTATDEYVTICEYELPYSYLDTIFEPGTATSTTTIFRLSTIHGCDSVVTLHLTVIPAYTPQITVDGLINPCVSSSATLSVTGTYAAYTWSNGATTSTITVDEANYYWVEVMDIHGCTGLSETIQLGTSELITDTAKICMVGVENNHNLVVWEQLDDPDVQNYRIYRENNFANVFEPLALIPASATNAYEDVTADPSVRAYRYKITAVDACGGETPISDYHKTVHLTINQGLGNSWNLIWTPYEGFEFSSYRLYRGTANNNLQLIQTMPSTLTTFTDNNPAGDALFYQIEVVMDGSCVQHTRDVTFTGARSNIVYNGTPVAVEVSVDACNTYDWNGQTLTASGDYTQTFSSDLGYDSVVTLHLTIHPSVTSEFSETAYDSYTWNGVTYTESGNYTQTLQTVYGCDSIVTLHLTLTVGINEFQSVDFKVYPNPTSNIVNVECIMHNEDLGEMELHLCDAYGRLLGVVRANDDSPLQTVQIDLSRYANGVYFVKLMAEDRTIAVRKIVKQ